MEFRTKREAIEAAQVLRDAIAFLESEAKRHMKTTPRREEMEQCAARIRALLPSLPDGEAT